MDQVVSPFGRDNFNYGVEGETYDIIDGKYIIREGIDSAKAGIGAQFGSQYEVWMVGMGPLSRDGQGQILTQKAIDRNLENFLSGKVRADYDPAIPVFTSEEGEEKAGLENALNTFINENEAKFICEIRDISDWDSYLEEVEKIGDIDKLLELSSVA